VSTEAPNLVLVFSLEVVIAELQEGFPDPGGKLGTILRIPVKIYLQIELFWTCQRQ
jgi:hypothetical protein